MENSAASGHCPLCQAPLEPAYRPFCSRRCQLLDLGHWLGEGYRIAAAAEEDSEAIEREGVAAGQGGET